MVQKLIVGLLVLTVIGAVGVGVYDVSQNDDATDMLLAQEGAPLPSGLDTTTTISAEPAIDDAPLDETAPVAVPETGVPQTIEQEQAVDQVGEPWAGSGTIASFDEAGMTLELADASQIYIELGPQPYWTAQGVTLLEGDNVTVTGFFNGEQYHAATVTKMDGAQLALRTAEGLPLWSGGANGNGNDGAHDDGAEAAEPQVAVEDWITVEGTIAVVNNNALTLQTPDGKTLKLQLGQPHFIEDQGISFVEGDPIRVIGYWEGNAFKAGEITNLTTGERLMLLDPNGRPLWGGPGRNGASQGQTAQAGNPTDAIPADGTGQDQGQGQGGGGNGNAGEGSSGNGDAGQDGGSSGNAGEGSNGGGNGYQGGRNLDYQG